MPFSRSCLVDATAIGRRAQLRFGNLQMKLSVLSVDVIISIICKTRLRFNLRDDQKIQFDKLNNLSMVVETKYQNKELQIVIGTDVTNYDAAAEQLELDKSSANQSGKGKKEKKGIISLFMDTVSGVFCPIVPAYIGK